MTAGPVDRMHRLRTPLRFALGAVVSLGCLYFATRGTDWGQVGAVLASVRIEWMVASMAFGLAGLYIRAQRWRVLLRPLGAVPLYPAFSATAIGFGASAVLPFRVGELVRPALLGRRVGVRMSAALSSVVLERLLDVLLVITCFLALSVVYPMPDALRRGAYGLATFAGVGFVVLLLVQRRRDRAEALAERVFARLPARLAHGLRPLASSFLSGLGGLADGRTVLLVLAYSVYLWTVIAVSFGCGLLALDIDAPFVAASLASVVIVAAFVFLPQAPGFVGTWQAGCVLALGLFGVARDEAVGFSLLTWIAQMVVSVGTAGIFLAREDFSVTQLLEVAERDAPTGAGS